MGKIYCICLALVLSLFVLGKAVGQEIEIPDFDPGETIDGNNDDDDGFPHVHGIHNNNDDSDGDNVYIIVLSVVGGVIVLAVIVAALSVGWKKYQARVQQVTTTSVTEVSTGSPYKRF